MGKRCQVYQGVLQCKIACKYVSISVLCDLTFKYGHRRHVIVKYRFMQTEIHCERKHKFSFCLQEMIIKAGLTLQEMIAKAGLTLQEMITKAGLTLQEMITKAGLNVLSLDAMFNYSYHVDYGNHTKIAVYLLVNVGHFGTVFSPLCRMSFIARCTRYNIM